LTPLRQSVGRHGKSASMITFSCDPFAEVRTTLRGRWVGTMTMSACDLLELSGP